MGILCQVKLEENLILIERDRTRIERIKRIDADLIDLMEL